MRTLHRWGRTDIQLAAELTQDVFLKLCVQGHQALRDFKGDNDVSLSCYLRSIASRLVVDFLRSERPPALPIDELDQAAAPRDEGPAREVERKMLLDRIDKCLSSDKPRDRRIFWLRHRYDFKPAEIAALPGISLAQSGVETILSRLAKSVEGCLKKGPKPNFEGDGS